MRDECRQVSRRQLRERPGSLYASDEADVYFNALDTLLKVVFNCVPNA
jgi:hypothetical protein